VRRRAATWIVSELEQARQFHFLRVFYLVVQFLDLPRVIQGTYLLALPGHTLSGLSSDGTVKTTWQYLTPALASCCELFR
jgi:hypothetical protein